MIPAVRVEGLSYSYPGGQEALRDVDLFVEPGEKLAIVGSNGAGKSTFLLHLNGILRGEGRVVIEDLEVREANLREIRSRVGLVFQDPDDQLFSPTVLEDVAFGPLYMGLDDGEVRRRALQALRLVGMEELGQRAPDRMSLGERKLAALATVLSMRPSILALDEPTSALDANARRRISGVLDQLDQTVIVATHDLSLVRTFGRTAVFAEGRIVADGATKSILDREDLLRTHGLI